MRVKARRRGRKLYGVVHDYSDPATGPRCQLSILPPGKHATVAEALKVTDKRIVRLKMLEATAGLAELARYRAWLRVCHQAGSTEPLLEQARPPIPPYSAKRPSLQRISCW
jgi:hypothetical protein